MQLSKPAILLCLMYFICGFPFSSFAQPPGDGDDEAKEILEDVPEEKPVPADAEPPSKDATENNASPTNYYHTLEGPGPVASPGGPHHRVWSPWRKPSRVYNPHFGVQSQLFVARYPSDVYVGMNISAQFHLSSQVSASFDLRAGGGIDRDGDHYAHPLGLIGGSLAYWWHGWDRVRRWRPYWRVGAGWMALGEETFDDGSDDENHDWDKRRRLKKNGVPAKGHANMYIEGAAGLRWVLFPRLWYLAVGGALDLELGLVHDFYYDISDVGVQLALGLTIFF